MKRFKFLSLVAAMLLCVGNVCAQEDKTFCFVDADGNELADGATVTFYAEKELLFPEFGLWGPLEAKFALKIKNTTTSSANVAVRLITKDISSGDVTCCLGGACVPLKGNKDYTSGNALVQAGKEIDFPTEWFPTEGTYGTADFTAQLLKTDGGTTATGNIINIHCIYADPAGIADMESDMNAKVVGRYDVNGNKLTAPRKGLNIIKLSNGKTVKHIVK